MGIAHATQYERSAVSLKAIFTETIVITQCILKMSKKETHSKCTQRWVSKYL